MQKNIFSFFIFFLILGCCIPELSFSENALVQFEIDKALDNPKIIKAIDQDIRLYWDGEKHPNIKTNFGEFKTSKRTNKFGKSREKACQWALASAINVLQKRARREGGNAVVDIKSNIQNKEFSSPDSYECLCGFMMVNIALKGTVVKLAE